MICVICNTYKDLNKGTIVDVGFISAALLGPLRDETEKDRSLIFGTAAGNRAYKLHFIWVPMYLA